MQRQSRPIAVRQWPSNCGPKAVVLLSPPSMPSPSVVSPTGSSNSSNTGRNTGYIVLSDDDECDDGEQEQNARCWKKCKTEPELVDPEPVAAAGFPGAEADSLDAAAADHPDAAADYSEADYPEADDPGAAADDPEAAADDPEADHPCIDIMVLEDMEDVEDVEDDDDYEPDEKWTPEPGATTLYHCSNEVDWVAVPSVTRASSRKLQSGGQTVKSGTLSIKPLQLLGYNRDDSLQLIPFDMEEEFGDCTPLSEEAELDDEAARERVGKLLQTYEKVRLRIVQDSENSGVRQQPSRTAWNMMRNRGFLVNTRKRIGHVPGLEVGQVFIFRFEMMLVGLHHVSICGISTIGKEENQWGVPVACSLILSGGYQDDEDQGDTCVYVGQGGQNSAKIQVADQKFEKGNMALTNNCKLDLPVRVCRGTKENTPSGKLYTYDGLYQIERYWFDTGAQGFMVCKFFLRRLPGQNELGSRTVQFAGKLKSREVNQINVVCQDISGGQEPLPICAVNDVDDPPSPPTGYTYVTNIIYPPGFEKPNAPSGCKCRGSCGSADNCRCIRRNGGRLPYNKDGTLPEWKTVIYECGPHCRCPPTCPNRVSQRPQQHKLEVFKTPNRGWGVRSWDSIPYGSFICEYIGEMITSEEAERRVGNDQYIFDIDCIRGSKNRGVDVSCFFEEPGGGDLCDEVEEGAMSIDAVAYGNFARFINHSCSPNMFVQCVFYDHTDFKVPHIMMFASRHIRPLEELAYDYSYALDSVRDPQTDAVKHKPCLCGAKDCRKRLY